MKVNVKNLRRNVPKTGCFLV